MATSVADDVIGFIRESLLSGDSGSSLGPDDDLLGSGLVDSLGVMRLVGFLEKRYSVKVPPADVTIENFITPNTIAAYVQKLGGDDAGTPAG